jgi:hypothetical protein
MKQNYTKQQRQQYHAQNLRPANLCLYLITGQMERALIGTSAMMRLYILKRN